MESDVTRLLTVATCVLEQCRSVVSSHFISLTTVVAAFQANACPAVVPCNLPKGVLCLRASSLAAPDDSAVP